MLRYQSTPRGEKIAYHHNTGHGIGVVYLGGFMSDMEGTKALHLEKMCQKWSCPYLRFDYFGHGQSSGDFADGTIGQWLEDVLFVLDTLTQGPQILVGSSMGGWLMCLAALKRPQRIHALIGIASAPDFVDDFMRLSPEHRQALETDGVCYLPCDYGDKPYTITRALLEEAKQHRLLEEPIPIQCPVRLLHGLADSDVSWQKSIQLADKLESTDVRVTLVKKGDHRLSTAEDLALITGTLESVGSFAL